MDGGAGNDFLSYYYGPLNLTTGVAFDASNAVSTTPVQITDGVGGTDTVVNFERVGFSGTDLADSVIGSSGGDQISGAGGNDLINGAAGNDFINGDAGDDSIQGGEGSDSIYGGLGNDAIDGGNGFDWLLLDEDSAGGAVVDLVAGTASSPSTGADKLASIESVAATMLSDSVRLSNSAGTVWGLNGDDTLIGGSRDDFLNGGVGNDSIDGGAGIDGVGYGGDGANYVPVKQGVVVDLKAGTAQDGWGGTDSLASIELVYGTTFNDVLRGGNPASGSGTTDGFEGFRGEAGNDSIDGGAGFDRAMYDTSPKGIVGRFGGSGTGFVQDGLNGTDQITNIEEIRGSSFADSVVGTDVGVYESFEGRGGNDTFDGLGGTDRISFDTSPNGVNVSLAKGTAADGWGGTDTFFNVEQVRGSQLNDSIEGSAGNDYLDGRNGSDSVSGGAGEDTLIGSGGNDTLDGGSQLTVTDTANTSNQYDRADYSGESAAVVVNLSADGKTGTATGASTGSDTLIDIEYVVGTAFGDAITGSDRAVSEIFRGGRGDDSITGGSGGADDKGIDMVDYATATGGVSVNINLGNATGADGNDVLVGIEGILGSAFNDTFVGNDGNNFLQPGRGDDSIDGGAGRDQLSFGNATSAVSVDMSKGTATGGDGNDTFTNIEGVRGSDFGDTLIGDDQANDFQGRAGNDSVSAGAGDDTMHGGVGNDVVDGGAGSDTARYTGIRSEYSIAFNATSKTLTVTDNTSGRDGVDTLSNVERLRFGDGTFLVNAQGGLTLDDPNFFSVDPAGTYLAGTESGVKAPTEVTLSAAGLVVGDVVALTRYGTYKAGSTHQDTSANMVAMFVDASGNAIEPVAFNRVLTPAQTRGTGVEVTDVPQDFDVSNGVTLVQVPQGAVAIRFSVRDTQYADNTDPNGDFGVFVRKYNPSVAFSGTDNVFGSAGDDSLFGGAGADVLVGGAGNDLIDGNVMTDRIRSTDANTVSYSNSPLGVEVNLSGITGDGSTGSGTAQDGLGGTDTLRNVTVVVGSPGGDSIVGSTAAVLEQFEGGGGNDTIDGGTINSSPVVGANNRVNYHNSPSAVTVNFATGTASGGSGNDTLININQVRGSDFDDVLSGSDATAYTEFFEGRKGNDSIDGKGGTDMVRYDTATAGVNVNLATGTAQDGYGTTDKLSNIEGVLGSMSADVITGGATANGNGTTDGFEFFQGFGGNDSIDGGKGWDRADYTLSPAGVTVTLGSLTKAGSADDGFGGKDVLLNIEAVRGSTFADRMVSSDRNTYSTDGYFESFEGMEGNDTIDGSAGGPTRADYSASPKGVTVDLQLGQADDGLGGVDRLIGVDGVRGSAFADRIIGDAGHNILDGGAGNDTLTGGKGNDTLWGLTGDDTYVLSSMGDGFDVIADSGRDNLANSSGYGSADALLFNQLGDQVDVEIGTSATSPTDLEIKLSDKSSVLAQVTIKHQLAVNASGAVTGAGLGALERLILQDPSGASQSFNLTFLTGTANDDLVFGTSGADSLSGLNGSDLIFGGNGADVLSGGDGDDFMAGGAGADSLTGGAGDDELDGGAGDDVVDGGVGNDTLLLRGNVASYAVTRNSDGTLKVVDSRDGSTDAVSNVERLSFWDADVDLAPKFFAGNSAVQNAQNSINGTPLGDLIKADDLAVAAQTSIRSDHIDGGDGDDVIQAGAGNDWIRDGKGSDSVDGGAGEDQVYYSGKSSDYKIGNDTAGNVTVTNLLDKSVDVLSNVESVYFQTDNKWIGLVVRFNPATGNQEWSQNWIQGTDANDAIDADQMADAHTWATGSTKTYKDGINAGLGNDSIKGGKGADWIEGGAGNDTIDGGPVVSLIDLSKSNSPWQLYNNARYSGLSSRYDITPGVDTDGKVTGTVGQAYFTVKDKRSGSPDGTDIVFNMDVLQFSDKQVRLTPELWVNREWVQDSVSGGMVPSDKITGVSINGTSAAEILGARSTDSTELKTLFAGSDRLEGKEGNDSLFGHAGADTLRGDKGNDTLNGGDNRPANQTQTWDPNGSQGGDVAEYLGAADRYTITRLVDTAGTVTGTANKVYFKVVDSKGDSGEGEDVLIDVEAVRFSDGEKNLTVTANPWMSGGLNPTIEGVNWRGSDFEDTIDVSASTAYAAYQANIDAGDGNDTIKGGNGADNISPGEGDDSIDGGANVARENQPWNNEDSVRYDVAKSRFTITRDSSGVVTVRDKLSDEFGGLGTDKLKNVERIDFGDNTSMRLLVRFNPNTHVGGSNNVEGTDFGDVIDADALKAAAPAPAPAPAPSSTTGTSGTNSGTTVSTVTERDWIKPEGGDDTVFGGNGGDQIMDGAGNDFYDGGPNGTSQNSWERNDIVQFSGPKSRYTVEALSYGTSLPAAIKSAIDARYPNAADRPALVIKVTDRLPATSGGDGVNYLVNIEGVQFANTGGSDSFLSLAVNVNKANDANGRNYYDGTILSEVIDARTAEANNPTTLRDELRGDLGNDSLYGGKGADEFRPGAGNDFVDGGTLEGNTNNWDYDTVAYAGKLSRYSVSFFRLTKTGETGTHNAQGVAVTTGGTHVVSAFYDPQGIVVVTDSYAAANGGEGRDVLKNIQALRFSDGYVNLNVQADSNGNMNGTLFADRIEGRASQANNINGGSGNDLIIGGSDVDVISGQKGDDTIDGGANPSIDPNNPQRNQEWQVADAAGYWDYNRNEFVVSRATDTDGKVTGTVGKTYYTVKHLVDAKFGGLGTDTIFNVESLRFKDTQEDLAVFSRDGWTRGTNFADKIDQSGLTLTNPWIVGNGGDDTIIAGAAASGGTQIRPGAGNDSVKGSATTGGDDNVWYDGEYERFTIVQGATANTWTVTDKLDAKYGGEGTDTLINISRLVFQGSNGQIQWGGTFQQNGQRSGNDSIVGGNGNDQLQQGGNDSVQDGYGNDSISAGAGDDTIQAASGNDLIDGGADSSATPGANFWSAGDVVQFQGPRIRYDIVANSDGSYTVIDLASLKVLNDQSFGADGHLTAAAMADSNIQSGVGSGKDVIKNVERLWFSDVRVDLVPMTQTWTYTSNYWDGTANAQVEVTRNNISGTFRGELLKGTDKGDQFDGRGGNDTIDGGANASGKGNPWDLQDVVQYSGAASRYEIRGVLVDIGGTSANPTYTIRTSADASGDEVVGVIVKDSMPDSLGGSGEDLLVNVERVAFAWEPGTDSSVALVPEVWTYPDMSSPLKDSAGKPILDSNNKPTYGTSISSQGTIFADQITGGDYSDWLNGRAGNDTLLGGKGGDDLEGGAGNDLLVGGDNGIPDANGWARTDTARYNAPMSRFVITPTTHEGQDAFKVTDLLGSADDDSLGEDVLVGIENISFNDNWINLVPNRWSWTDPEGNVSVGVQGTKLSETIAGDRNMDGTAATKPTRDNLSGGDGNDVLLGFGNGDQLNGGAGDDVLDGGANGSSGNSWQDADSAQFTGKSDRYAIGTVSVVADSVGRAVQVDGRTVAVINTQGTSPVLTMDTAATETETSLITRAFQNDLLALGQTGLMVVDTLDSDLGGDGADLVFNVEQLNFADGPLELGARAWVNDWNQDGKIDNIWINGSNKGDKVDMASIATLTGRKESDLVTTQFSSELRAGDDSYFGGSGSDWVRPGAGNDYINGGANEGSDQWGNANRDEVSFNARFSRFTLVDVTLTKGASGWTVTSTRNPDMVLTNGVLTDPTETSEETLAGMEQGLKNLIAGAGASATSVSGWLVIDKLPAEFDGLGVDAITGVEFLSFSDKWMPLQQQVWYHREQVYNETTKRFEPGTKIVGSHSDGTNEADVMGYKASLPSNSTDYNFAGNDGFQGNDGNDSMFGGAGGDWFRGGAGDDFIDGGTDGVDMNGNPQGDNVQYSGEFSRYLVTSNADGSVSIKDSQADGDGTDKLVNVESVSFSDRWVRLTQELNVWKDKSGRVQNVNANGSLLGERIDLSKTTYTGAHHSIWGQEGDDTIVGSDSPDWINGGMGADQIDGGANGVDFWGNPGSDTVQYEGLSSRYTVERIRPGGQDSAGVAYNGQTFVINGVSYYVDGTANAITVNGQTVQVDLIRVTDSLGEEDGGSGVDLLVNVENLAFLDRWVTLKAQQNFVDLDGDGKPDAVNIRGTDGDDTLAAGDVNARIEGGNGNDRLTGGKGDDVLVGGVGNDSLVGGDGRDVAQFSGAQSSYTITSQGNNKFTVTSNSEGTDTLDGIEAIQFEKSFVSLVQTTENLDFNADGITDQIRIKGIGVVANTLNYASNTDAKLSYNLIGGEKDDSMTGGSGNDVLEGGAGNDVLNGGAGSADRARYLGDASNYTVTSVGSGVYTVAAKTGGTEGTDTLSNIEEIRFADQVMRLGDNASQVTFLDLDTDGNKKDDTRIFTGTSGNDSITGSSSLMNVMDAGAGADVLTGGDLGDTFKPGAGNDTIDGGANQGVGSDFKAAVDKVLFTGNQADYTVAAVQKASMTLGGAVDNGDVFSVTVSGTAYSTTATSSSTKASVAAALKTAIEAGAGSGVSVSFDATSSTLSITSTGSYLTVQGSVTNGTSGDAATAFGAVSYERFVQVTHKTSSEADLLKNIEQLVFADKVFNVNPAESSSAQWGSSGLTTVRSISGTDLADIIRSASGVDEMRGGGGVDRFVFGESSGADRITDFQAGAGGDVITIVLSATDTDGLNGTGAKSVQDILNRATEQNGSVKIDLGNGHSITLVGVLLANLTAANFDVVPNY